jgi:hypothetical protein
MAKKTPKPIHATREQWLQAFTDASRPLFKAAGAPLPKTVRVSIGFPSKGRRSNAIGECFHSSASEDGVREIFIRPSLQSSPIEIAHVLTHELCHAALPDGEGHGREFGKAARALGLVGKLTSTTAGPLWHEQHDPILAALGAFPGAKLGDGVVAGGPKKQSTRMVKLACPDCGWSFRTSRQNIDAMTDHTCLACGDGQLSTGE